MITIKNEFLTAIILPKGAEVLSIINNKTGYNYLWEKNPSIWDNTSPVLFPTVGKSVNNEIRYNGKIYPFLNHGLARYEIFKVEQQSENAVSLIFRSCTLKKDVFPFSFTFMVTYKLHHNSMTTTYSVSNPSDRENSYFSVGAHPAFKLPFDDNHSLKDYYIRFPHDDILTVHELTKEATYTGKTSSFNLKNNCIDLGEYDVSNTFVFSNFDSKHILLCEKQSNKFIKFHIEGFPYLAFWKKPEGNFLCVEPWCGKSDDADFKGNFNEKKDIISLKPLEKWHISYTTEFNF